MRKLTSAELAAVANLYQMSQEQREVIQAQERTIISLGQSLPLITQVLSS